MNQEDAKQLLCEIIEQVPKFISMIYGTGHSIFNGFDVHASQREREIYISVDIKEGKLLNLFNEIYEKYQSFEQIELIFKALQSTGQVMDNPDIVITRYLVSIKNIKTLLT
jgi:hypothetical protein